MSIEEAVSIILLALDTRSRKIYFPFKAYFVVYIRPFFPDYVDNKLKK